MADQPKDAPAPGVVRRRIEVRKPAEQERVGGWIVCGKCGRLYHDPNEIGKFAVKVIHECQGCQPLKGV